MYRITFLTIEEEVVSIFCNGITHSQPLALNLSNIQNEDLVFSNDYDIYKTIRIEVLNNEGVYNYLIPNDLEVLSIKIINNEMYILLEENYDLHNYFGYETFKYIELILLADKREWLKLNDSNKVKWLFACLQSNREPKKFSENISLEGIYITSELSFLCEIGEQVIGVGGYLGLGLSALEDCLLPNYYKGFNELKLNIQWNNFNVHNFLYKDIIVEILEESSKINLSLN